MKLSAAFDVAILIRLIALGLGLVWNISGVFADDETLLADSPHCPPGTRCVHPFRCTMTVMANSLEQPGFGLEPETMPRYRCRINAQIEGICCQTDDAGAAETVASVVEQQEQPSIEGRFSGSSIESSLNVIPRSDERNSSQQQQQQQQQHRIRAARAIMDYERLSPSVHSRTKRCIDGPKCIKKHNRYRSADGRCNNVGPGKSLWGSMGYPMERILPPAYADGVWAPRINALNGEPLPGARALSMALFDDLHVPHAKFNVLMMQFGQFLTHDISRGKPMSTNCDCCRNCTQHQHPECFPIPVAHNDPFYAEFNVRCLQFKRIEIAPMANCLAGHGRQLSAVTHFIDGSGIYGSSSEETNALRSHEGGQLRSLKHPQKHYELLPIDSLGKQCNSQAKLCFKTGDIRSNQLLSLVAVHTLFMREHNRIARSLGSINPHWDDETIFQEARRIVIAELQHIVYNEYLPNVVGPKFMDQYELEESDGYSEFYDPRINPTVTSEFSTAAFRFGHSTVPGKFELPNSVFKTHETFFDPSPFGRVGFYDEMFQGILEQPMQKVDDFFTHSLTWFLHPKEKAPFGKDLVSINIQRGRDHAIQPYNFYVYLSGRCPVQDFDEFRPEVGPILKKLYPTPNDIDLFVGGMLEPPVKDGLVGETFAEIIADQFARLKEGDRYFYSNGPETNPGHFTEEQVEELQQVTLASVLCANTDDKRFAVPPDAFQIPHEENAAVPCNSGAFPAIDLKLWKDCTESD